jgi:DNA-binding MarR family transcriptional regulator
MSKWTLFSNHGHVLVCLASDSDARLRDVAADVGITERAVQKIVRDLQTNGMISVTKHGRRNRYRIHNKKNLRHELEAHCTLGDLMRLVAGSKPARREFQNDYITGSNDIPVTQVEAKPAVVESAQTDISETESLAPKSVESEPVESELVELESAETSHLKPRSAEPKSEKSIASDSKERQQGSLF